MLFPVVLSAMGLYAAYRLFVPRKENLMSKYMVAPGDNLDAIAARFGVTSAVIANMNPKGMAAPKGVTDLALALPNVKDFGARVGARGKAS